MADDAIDFLGLASGARKAKKPLEAERYYRAALERDAGDLAAMEALVGLLAELGRHEEVIVMAEGALAGGAISERLLHLLVKTRIRLNQRQEALAAAERFVERAPESAFGWSTLADALAAQRRAEYLPRAQEAAGRAAAMEPDNAIFLLNLGRLQLIQGELGGAIGCLERVLALDPRNVVAHGLLGMALLSRGEYPRGLAEWSWHYDHVSTTKRPGDRPMWDGSSPAGQTVLVYADQGQGDMIHFIRYAKMLAERGAKVVVQCPPALKRLLVGCPYIGAVREGAEALPPHDVRTPVSFLPQRFGTTLETIPAEVPYLAADERAVGRWRRKLCELKPGLKVGLAWRGSPGFATDELRSTTLQTLAPLGGLPGVTLVSLQKGKGSEEAREGSIAIVDWTDQLKDFADTAALIAALDMVISVDTAVAHLAGALARPVWIMLPFAADWRWLLKREDSPWYPTARLLRQERPCDWTTVVAAMVEQLGRRMER